MSSPQEHRVITTPLSAIRQHCRWCSNEQPKEVRFCSSEACPLHLYRMGVLPAIERRSALKAIHARCIDCVGGSTRDLAECQTDCALNPFRFGRNPNYGDGKRSRARLLISAQKKKIVDHSPVSQSRLAGKVIWSSSMNDL